MVNMFGVKINVLFLCSFYIFPILTNFTSTIKTTNNSNTSVSQPSAPASPQPWRARLNNLKMTFLGSPRFYRKISTSSDNQQPAPLNNGVQKKTVILSENPVIIPPGTATTPSNVPSSGRTTAESSPDSSPLLTNKSWFESFLNPVLKYSINSTVVPQQNQTELSTCTITGLLPASLNEDNSYVTMIKDRPIDRLKADLVQSLLSSPGVVHTVVSPTSFKAEYRIPAGSSILTRPVKTQVDLVRASPPSSDREAYAVNFQLLSGPSRRFKRLCENLQTALLNCQSISGNCNKTCQGESDSMQNNGCGGYDENIQSNYISKDILFKYPSNTSLVSVCSKSGDSQMSSKHSSTPPKRGNSAGVPLTDSINRKNKRLSVTSISAAHSNRSNSMEKSSFSSSNSSSSLTLLNNDDEALNGFVFIVSCDGEVFSASRTVEYYLGFHQSDILHQSVLELIHSKDREEFKRQLSWSALLPADKRNMSFKEVLKIENCLYLQRCFTVRFRCLLDNTSGFITLEINGRLQFLYGQTNGTKETDSDRNLPPLGLFAVCSPFGHLPNLDAAQRDLTFKTKHNLDLSFIAMDVRAKVTFGYSDKEIVKLRAYHLIHQDDLNYLAKGHEEIFKNGTIGLLVHRWWNKAYKWVWLQSSLKIIFKSGKQNGIMATHRQLTQDEGRELYTRRNTEYKLPFRLLEPETLLDDEEEELQGTYKANKRPRSQLKDYLQASRKRKAPYRDVLPCYSSGYTTYNPFATISNFGSGSGAVGPNMNDLSYSYQNIPNFPGFEIDFCKSYRNQYLASSFDQYISPNDHSGYYYGYDNYNGSNNYNNPINIDRPTVQNPLFDMEAIKSQMTACSSLSELDPMLSITAKVPKLLSPYLNSTKNMIYPKYSFSDEFPYSNLDPKTSHIKRQSCPICNFCDQQLLNMHAKDEIKPQKSEMYRCSETDAIAVPVVQTIWNHN